MASRQPIDQMIQRTLEKCVNCGSCQAVCPVYTNLPEEGACARGKLQLIRAWREGHIELTREVAAIFHQCSLCGRCAKGCSNGARGTDLFKAMRAVLVNAHGSNALKSHAAGRMFGSPLLLKTALATAKVSSGLSKRIPRESGLWLRFPMLKGVDRLFSQSVAPYVGRTDRVVDGPRNAPRLALFTGCMANFLHHRLLDTAVALFSRKFTVVIPAGQGCCGLPATSAGNRPAMETAVRRNITAMAGPSVDVITTVCVSCTYQLKKVFTEAGNIALAEKVRDGLELLAETPEVIKGKARGKEVDAHISCHMAGLELEGVLERVIAISGAILKRTSRACCGGGGLLPVNAPRLADKLMAQAGKDIFKKKRDITTVVVGCSGCRIQWLRNSRQDQEVCHLLELFT